MSALDQSQGIWLGAIPRGALARPMGEGSLPNRPAYSRGETFMELDEVPEDTHWIPQPIDSSCFPSLPGMITHM